MTRGVTAAVATALVAPLAVAAVVVAMFGSVLVGTTGAGGGAVAGGSACVTTVAVGPRTVALDEEQRANSASIITTGRSLGVPDRGLVIALATAMQESTLRNLDYGDRDSLGLFQQRPSQGWGTPAQVRDPVHAATRFYQRLVQVPGWLQLPLTVAAQRVQRSAFPNAYARWESLGVSLVASAVPTGAGGGAAVLGCGSAAPVVQRGGAVGEMLRAALAQQGDPYVFGGTGPDAFDCSGLLVYAWRQAGYRLTVRTADQMHRSSVPVAPGQEQPGDIVFSQFGTRVAGAGHMMIVVEPGLAVEAPSSGKTVRLRPYDPHAAGQRLGRLQASVLVPVPGGAVGS